MKLRENDLRKIIKEEISSIPSFALQQLAEECSDGMKRLMINHINTKSNSPKERQQMTVQMNKVMKDLENEVKELLDSKLSEFLNKSSR